jgi:hypothetical protein
VFLTNSLTSWEPPVKPNRLPFVELEEESDAADVVKREKPILVILGNHLTTASLELPRSRRSADFRMRTALSITRRFPPRKDRG